MGGLFFVLSLELPGFCDRRWDCKTGLDILQSPLPFWHRQLVRLHSSRLDPRPTSLPGPLAPTNESLPYLDWRLVCSLYPHTNARFRLISPPPVHLFLSGFCFFPSIVPPRCVSTPDVLFVLPPKYFCARPCGSIYIPMLRCTPLPQTHGCHSLYELCIMKT